MPQLNGAALFTEAQIMQRGEERGPAKGLTPAFEHHSHTRHLRPIEDSSS